MDVLSGTHHFSSSPLLTPYIASPLCCSGFLLCSIVSATSQRVIWGLVYLLTLCYPLWQDKVLNQNMNQLSLSMLFSRHWFHSKIFSVKETAPWLTLWCKLLFWGRPMFHETFVSITHICGGVFSVATENIFVTVGSDQNIRETFALVLPVTTQTFLSHDSLLSHLLSFFCSHVPCRIPTHSATSGGR